MNNDKRATTRLRRGGKAPRHDAVLLCNGRPPRQALVRRYVRRADLVVAADGGANAARAMGIRPDVILGDLDSITAATRKAFASSVIIRVARQDNTDMEKALDFCIASGVGSIVVLGATGGRLDMTLGNLSALWRYTRHFRITLGGDGWLAYPLHGRGDFAAPVGTGVSLIPYGDCVGVSLQGLKYPLVDASLRRGEVAVSNVTTRKHFSVTCSRGSLLVIVMNERAEWKEDRR